MLVFDLRDLASTAATVDDALSSTDGVWETTDRRPADGVRVTGRLSTAGPGRFYFSGQIAGSAPDECRRCLKDVETAVRERVQLVFAETGEDAADDPDVCAFDPRTHELDLRPAIREQWLLAVPTFAQCRDDCAGLCAGCGADLNLGPCGCPPSVDDRWAALRQVPGPDGTDDDANGSS
jgi:uncharacterized protein